MKRPRPIDPRNATITAPYVILSDERRGLGEDERGRDPEYRRSFIEDLAAADDAAMPPLDYSKILFRQLNAFIEQHRNLVLTTALVAAGVALIATSSTAPEPPRRSRRRNPRKRRKGSRRR